VPNCPPQIFERQSENTNIASTLRLPTALARHSHNQLQSNVTLGSSDDEDVVVRIGRGFGVLRPGWRRGDVAH
jgi:hypothetical protein